MKRSITSTADGRWRRISGVAPSASSRLVEFDGQHRLGGRQRHEPDLRRDHHAQRALGSDDHLREVERLRRIDELVEVVAADAAEHLGKAALDLGTRSPSQAHARRGGIQRRGPSRRRLDRAHPGAADESASPSRRRAPRRVRARGRWSFRRQPIAHRWSCWRSSRRASRGWRWRCRARIADRAGEAQRSTRRAPRRARPTPSAPPCSLPIGG